MYTVIHFGILGEVVVTVVEGGIEDIDGISGEVALSVVKEGIGDIEGGGL